MDISNVVKLNYIDSETGKSFKTVPKQYKSSFNKLTLFRNEYKIYCESIDPLVLNFESKLDDCDTELTIEYLNQEISNGVMNRIYNSTKVRW